MHAQKNVNKCKRTLASLKPPNSTFLLNETKVTTRMRNTANCDNANGSIQIDFTERQFACTFCEKCFRRRCNLTVHVRNFHSKERQHVGNIGTRADLANRRNRLLPVLEIDTRTVEENSAENWCSFWDTTRRTRNKR